MATSKSIQLIECPRDAMQGWGSFIPTSEKIRYLNALLKVGFHTLDMGSFVSPKAIPQMADTREVIRGIHHTGGTSKLLTIVANSRGATDAMGYDEIDCLGFPFSISPTFQLRNSNATMEASLEMVAEIQNLCVKRRKELVVYISMGFGNPYGDAYNESIVWEWVDKMVQLGIGTVAVADTVGLATAQQVGTILSTLIPAYPNTVFGVHLHATADNWEPKMAAALAAGCQRFDGALKGVGGCPMAGNTLVGNMDTARMIPYLKQLHQLKGIDEAALSAATSIADELFVQLNH